MKTVEIRQGSIIRLHSVPDVDWEVTWISPRFLVLARETEKDTWMISLIDSAGDDGPVRYEYEPVHVTAKHQVIMIGRMLAEFGLAETLLAFGDKEELPADICWVDGVDFFAGLSPDTDVKVRTARHLYEMN